VGTERPAGRGAGPRLLDLGCGRNKRAGAVGVDRSLASDADVVADLDRVPYPFADDSFDDIVMDNVLEHLGDVPAVLAEVHRIGRPGARLRILVPYFRLPYAAIDPTHRHLFTAQSLSYFDAGHPLYRRYGYTTADFEVRSVRFDSPPAAGVGGWWRAWLGRFATRHPVFYEYRLGHLLPVDGLTFDLRVRKDGAGAAP